MILQTLAKENVLFQELRGYLLTQLSQISEPLFFSEKLAAQKSDRLAGPWIERPSRGKVVKDRRSSREPSGAEIQDAGSLRWSEDGEQCDSNAEGIGRGSVFFGEVGEPQKECLLAFGGERVEFPGLATLPRRFPATHPGRSYESSEKRINEVVVHGAVAGHGTDALFEGVAVLGAVQKRSQD
jgi:hypothetical protein